jgi:hypothetical protein
MFNIFFKIFNIPAKYILITALTSTTVIGGLVYVNQENQKQAQPEVAGISTAKKREAKQINFDLNQEFLSTNEDSVVYEDSNFSQSKTEKEKKFAAENYIQNQSFRSGSAPIKTEVIVTNVIQNTVEKEIVQNPTKPEITEPEQTENTQPDLDIDTPYNEDISVPEDGFQKDPESIQNEQKPEPSNPNDSQTDNNQSDSDNQNNSDKIAYIFVNFYSQNGGCEQILEKVASEDLVKCSISSDFKAVQDAILNQTGYDFTNPNRENIQYSEPVLIRDCFYDECKSPLEKGNFISSLDFKKDFETENSFAKNFNNGLFVYQKTERELTQAEVINFVKPNLNKELTQTEAVIEAKENDISEQILNIAKIENILEKLQPNQKSSLKNQGQGKYQNLELNSDDSDLIKDQHENVLQQPKYVLTEVKYWIFDYPNNTLSLPGNIFEIKPQDTADSCQDQMKYNHSCFKFLDKQTIEQIKVLNQAYLKIYSQIFSL